MFTQFLVLFILACSSTYASWAEKTLQTMTLEEKIGQLFIIPACPMREEKHMQDLTQLLAHFPIGGIIPKQGDVKTHVALMNRLQALSKLPLLCVADAEWGLSMRLKDTIRFPKNLTLGAIQDMQLLYELGKEIGEECKKIGIHVNLAPVVDVNSNPQNRVIHMRSFGEKPAEVAERGVALMRGMQESGILACAKHFVGYGDASVDAHVDLPVVSHSLEHLETVELYPFQKMIKAGVACIMTAHLAAPALDESYLPASLSFPITDTLLKTKMGFSGVVISDALNMQALALHFSKEEVALRAFQAGNDLLLYGDHIAPNVDAILHDDIPRAFRAIKEAATAGTISLEKLDCSVLKILRCKEKLNLHQERFVQFEEPVESSSAERLKRELYEAAITLVQDKDQLLPLKASCVNLVQNKQDPSFLQALEKQCTLSEEGDLTILALYGNEEISDCKPDVVLLFGSPYNLERAPDAPVIIVAYEEDPDASRAAADLLFGKITSKGRLPISWTPR